ncbi:hypothetical protein ACFCZT_37915 [Streptomyces sp. NPDC056230]|uniref:hypothetical protein n=1 Tax=Streptomyces sp. NPDC056230 TaxID=3345754 RepID=UPI0035DB9642
MRRGIRNGLVAGWAVLTAGGWGLTQWLDEPSATDGPTPGAARTPHPSSDGGPGPQPEPAHDRACPTGTPAPLPSPTALPVDGEPRATVVFCARTLRHG